MTKPFESEIQRYIRQGELDNLISKLHKGAYISKGTFSSKGRGRVEDFEWNHLDQAHRIYVHDAYHDSLRIATSKDMAVSLTAWNNLPVYIQVADMRIDRGLFYQSFTVFGLIYCHQIARMTQHGVFTHLDIEWRTVSSKWLKFIHKSFNKRLLKLQTKQNLEDIPIRERRADLREKGFCFKTDDPDFFNSNVLIDMVNFPDAELPFQFNISNLKLNERQKIKMGPMEFYVVRSENNVQVWPAICTHEGAEMPETKFCEGAIACPWHNRKFKPTILQNRQGSYRFSNLVLTLEENQLRLKPHKRNLETVKTDSVSSGNSVQL